MTNTKSIQIVAKFSRKDKAAQIGKVLNKKGQSRFVALTENGTILLCNSVFNKKYSAVSIARQYLNS